MQPVPAPTIDRVSLSQWVNANPRWVYVLGLIVGLSRELTNQLCEGLDSSGSAMLTRTRLADLIAFLDMRFELVHMVREQLYRDYGLADILIAESWSGVADSARAVRLIEAKIEAIVSDLGLPYVTRTSFVGRNGLKGPGDLVIPDAVNAQIVVAVKGLTSREQAQ